MQRTEISTNRLLSLPETTLEQICDCLLPDEALDFGRAYPGSIIEKIVHSNKFWKKKYEKYFPSISSNKHLRVGIKVFSDDNVEYATNYWQAKFKAQENCQYPDFSLIFYKTFNLLKEGDVDRLKTMGLTFSDILFVDRHNRPLLSWARCSGNQALLNYIYKLALNEYTNKQTGLLNCNQLDGQGRTILDWAVYCRQSKKTIQILLNNYPNKTAVINAVRCYRTVLTIAAMDQPDIVQLLVENGADINLLARKEKSALRAAIMHDNVESISYLIQQGASLEESAALLNLAVANQSFKAVQYLLNNGFHVNDINQDNECPALLIAIKQCNLEIVRFLLQKRANCDFLSGVLVSNHTLLQTVLDLNREFIPKKQLDLLKLLISYTKNINQQNSYGETALFTAIYGNNLEAVKILIDAGIDITIKDEWGNTPVISAAKWGNKSILSYLLDHTSIAINAANGIGVTALIASLLGYSNAEAKTVETVKLLLAYGADIAYESKQGTAMSFAVRSGDIPVIDVLLNHYDHLRVQSSVHNEAFIKEIKCNLFAIVSSIAIVDDIQIKIFGKFCLILHKNGENLNFKNGHGQTLLMVAAKNGHCKSISYLCALVDVDINIQDKNGATALLLSIIHKQTDAALLLLSHQADPLFKLTKGNQNLKNNDTFFALTKPVDPEDMVVENDTALFLALKNEMLK